MYNYQFTNIGANIIQFGYARQCALIAVDEILDNNSNISDSDKLNHKYWFEVKHEIEKL